MTNVEFASLRLTVNDEIDDIEDRVHFFQLDPRMEPFFYGQA